MSVIFGTAIFAIVPVIYDGTGIQAQETPFTAISFGFPSEFLYVLSFLAPTITSVSWLFENRASELFAKRICSALSLASIIPFFAYTIDIICLNSLIGTIPYISQIMRVIILLTAIAKYVKAFKIELLFRRDKKEKLK